MSDAFYGFTAKGLEQETKKFVANPEEAEKRKKDFIEGAKSTATGVVTGTLGLPSDMLDLATMAAEFASKFGDKSVDSVYDYASMAKVMLPQIQNLQKKYGRQAFDEAFTAYTGVKSDASNPNQIIGELVGLGTVAKFGGKVLQKSADVATPYIEKGIDAVKNIFKDPPDIGPKPEFAGVKNVSDVNKQTDKLINKTPPKSKAQVTINPSMIGLNTPIGQKQSEKFLDLEKQGNMSPEQLFEETQVYRGVDGKLRYELDDTNAELKNIDNVVKDIELKKTNKETITLGKVLAFDDLYQQYFKEIKVGEKTYKPLKDIEVEFISNSDEAVATYNPFGDKLRINLDASKNMSPEKKKEFIASSILHEVQHAIQHREGFIKGTSINMESICS